ncbi:putative non-specific serine/threonine protein kinase [Helianthus annuus]|nr:putative non-specific serine/threonine protein kinase [Helianthus annuus]
MTDYCFSISSLHSFSSDEPFNLLISCILIILFILGLPPSSDPKTSKLVIVTGGTTHVNISDNQSSPTLNLTATLQDTGDFQLKNAVDNQILWKSFDYPTNVLLPGMKLGSDLRTGRNWNLTSWLSKEIPDVGAFTLSSVEKTTTVHHHYRPPPIKVHHPPPIKVHHPPLSSNTHHRPPPTIVHLHHHRPPPTTTVYHHHRPRPPPPPTTTVCTQPPVYFRSL